MNYLIVPRKKIYRVTTTMENNYNACHYIYKTLIQPAVNVEVFFYCFWQAQITMTIQFDKQIFCENLHVYKRQDRISSMY